MPVGVAGRMSVHILVEITAPPQISALGDPY